MNKRIEELTLRTDAWCEQNLPANWTDDVDQYLPLWNAKFAELIVQECMELCKAQEYDYWRTEEHLFDFTPIDCANAIKEHFGIEE